jgi:hypothetical protein
LSFIINLLNPKLMKSAVKTLILLSICSVSFAQLKLPVSNPISSDIKKVVADYPNCFSGLTGELIVQNPQSADYQCNFIPNGAEDARITHYSSGNNNVCSWQATFLTTESFEKARQKFKSIYGQLNNMSVSPGGMKSYPLKGAWEQPVEEKKFTTVVFSLRGSEDQLMEKLKVEVSMQYELLEWKVRVLVYSKEREDNERGKTIE